MKPRQILKGTTYMVTRKTAHGMYLLTPSKKVKNCIRYCIALAQKRSKVLVHSIVFLSNHYHIVLTDPHGNVPVFTEELNKLIARALNSKLGRRENFWSSGKQTSQVALAEAGDVLDKTVYVLANPTKALLVSRGSEWPGVRIFRKGKYRATKPKFFFRSIDSGGELPEIAHVEISPPPIGVKASRCDDVVDAAVKAEEKKLRLEAKKAGKTFLGAAKVKAQNVYASPQRPAPSHTLSPQLACRNEKRRIELLKQLTEFVSEHEAKREAFIAGEFSVVFPAGTYKMVRQCGACCEKL